MIMDCLRLVDLSVILAAAISAYAARFAGSEATAPSQLSLVAIGLLISPYVLRQFGNYSPGRPSLIRTVRLVNAWAAVFACLLSLTFLSKTGQNVSRLWIGLWFAFGLLGLIAVRLGFDRLLQRWRRGGQLAAHIVVIGASDLAKRFADSLRSIGDPSVRLLGVFDDEHPTQDGSPSGSSPDGLAQLLEFARMHHIDHVIITLPWAAEDRLAALLKKLRCLPADILLAPNTRAPWITSCRLLNIGGAPFLHLVERPLTGWGYIAKAAEDRLLGSILLILASPLMLVIALMIKLDSPGAILFRQKRNGLNNSVIEILKFRTMRTEVNESGLGAVTQATRHDPRVTRVGRWLRQTSLDELPQLINVVCGQMSLVGPRPHAVVHNKHYERVIDTYVARYRVKPGITGWAQINGFRGETDTEDKMKLRIEHDLYYIDHWSIPLDAAIIIRTLLGGFFHRNAY